jgi:hypothetical protein
MKGHRKMEGEEMEAVIESLAARPVITLGLGAFLSGVALMYLVMQRTRKRRVQQAQQNNA